MKPITQEWVNKAEGDLATQALQDCTDIRQTIRQYFLL